ncbi:MAG: 50S ribosomal protein L4, partial [Verrucomicrobia bacterium]|nr:50S ribosomal protein L4 [Verrucomicrobiota bacterium]
MKGESIGDFDFSDELLVHDKGLQALQNAVVAHRAAQRAGSASTLTKSEVAGSGRKPWRQKGLGRARAGYRQSPVWRGGGVAFGPKPRSYAKKISKKGARLAFRRAFSEKIAAG